MTKQTQFQKKIESWKRQTPAQLEQTRKNLERQEEQARWELQQIQLEREALNKIVTGNPLATNQYAALANIDDDEPTGEEMFPASPAPSEDDKPTWAELYGSVEQIRAAEATGPQSQCAVGSAPEDDEAVPAAFREDSSG